METSNSSAVELKQDNSSSESSILVQSWLKRTATIIIWIELILGLSAISSAVFLNPRVPVLLYALYGAYFAIFLGLLYSTCRHAYLQNGPLTYVYWILGGCTLATVAVVFFTFLTAPNSGEIAFIATIVFLVCLVLFPFIGAILYCFLRGNIILPLHLRRGKSPTRIQKIDQSNSSNGVDGSKPSNYEEV